MLLNNPAMDFLLFAPPRELIALADYAAALHAATIVPDGGTLQIGIGSLGDAVVQSLVLRHLKNDDFRRLIDRLCPQTAPGFTLHPAPFETGLYGCSEMFVEHGPAPSPGRPSYLPASLTCLRNTMACDRMLWRRPRTVRGESWGCGCGRSLHAPVYPSTCLLAAMPKSAALGQILHRSERRPSLRCEDRSDRRGPGALANT